LRQFTTWLVDFKLRLETAYVSTLTFESSACHCNAMPRDDDLNEHEKMLVQTIVKYDIVAERCAAKLRQYDRALVERLWAEGESMFMGNPTKYPVITALQQDMDGRNRFRMKCQGLCFPPERPRCPEECVSCALKLYFSTTLYPSYIMMYFGAVAGMQAAYQDADEYPHRQDLCRIAKARS
jgi:hypothetical protein